MSTFLAVCDPSRDKADDAAAGSLTMDDNEDAACGACAKQHKTLLVARVIRIGKQERLLVFEHGLGFREAHPVLPEVLGSFARVPFEADLLHTYNVSTLYCKSRRRAEHCWAA